MSTEKFILDATSGFRMMWFDKHHPNAIYLDQRPECEPDIVGDFRDLKQFKDETFRLIVFDPPHMGCGKNSIMKKKFGVLPSSWRTDFYHAFKEFHRILQPYGTLITKWNDHDQPAERVIAMADGWRPLFGQKTAERTKHSSKTL